MTSSTTNKRGFTMIELLTVIGIIAILVALLFPAIKTVMAKTEVNQAKADTKNIETAIKSYYNEYGKLPTTDQGVPDKLYDVSNAYNIYNTLRAIPSGWNAGNALNPRQIVYLETPARKNAFDANGNFLDPWGYTYVLAFDCNYDGTLSGLSAVGTNYNGRSLMVVVASYGPDHVAGTSDDITNYQ